MQHFDHISHCHTPIGTCIIHGVRQSNLVWHVNCSTAFWVPFCRCVQADCIQNTVVWGHNLRRECCLVTAASFSFIKKRLSEEQWLLKLAVCALATFLSHNAIKHYSYQKQAEVQWASIPVTVVEKTHNIGVSFQPSLVRDIFLNDNYEHWWNSASLLHQHNIDMPYLYGF